MSTNDAVVQSVSPEDVWADGTKMQPPNKCGFKQRNRATRWDNLTGDEDEEEGGGGRGGRMPN